MTLAAKGVKDTTGVVGFALFSSADGWPNDVTKAYKNDAVAAKAGTVEWKLTGIKPGSYAIVALHDENRNKKIDKKASGRPKEGWGMSRDPKAGLKTPKFESAVTPVKCGDRIEMTLRYPKPNEDN